MAVDAAPFPHRRHPRSALPHAGETFRVVEPPPRLVELTGLGESNRGRHAKSHRARLAHTLSGKPAIALPDRVRRFRRVGCRFHSRTLETNQQVRGEPSRLCDLQAPLHQARGAPALTASERDFRQSLQ